MQRGVIGDTKILAEPDDAGSRTGGGHRISVANRNFARPECSRVKVFEQRETRLGSYPYFGAVRNSADGEL